VKITNKHAQVWLAFCCVYGGGLFTLGCFLGITGLIFWMLIVATN
jgi:hypothetical protein